MECNKRTDSKKIMMEKTLKAESDVISGLLIVNFAVTLKVFSYQE